MKRSAGLLVLLVSASAIASPDPIVTAPAKWRLDRERSATMNAAAQGVRHFGAAPSIDVTEAYYPGEVGLALIVTRSTTTELPDGRDRAIAAAVDELEAWHTRTESAGTPLTDKIAGHKVIDGKLLEVTIAGRDASASMRQTFRMVVAAGASSVVAVTGVCLERDDANPEHVAACRAALTTLDPGIAIAERVAVGFPVAGTEPAPSPIAESVSPHMSEPGHETTAHPAPAQLGDGSRFKMSPINVAPAKQDVDRRPVYLGLGLVVLAGLFWWSRRQRERFVREDVGTPAPADTDADDLHAAAADDENPKDDV